MGFYNHSFSKKKKKAVVFMKKIHVAEQKGHRVKVAQSPIVPETQMIKHIVYTFDHPIIHTSIFLFIIPACNKTNYVTQNVI